MPLWLPFAAVLGCCIVLSLLAWAACKVAGDADDWERTTLRWNDNDAMQQAIGDVPNPTRLAVPIPDVEQVHSTPIRRKAQRNHG